MLVELAAVEHSEAPDADGITAEAVVELVDEGAQGSEQADGGNVEGGSQEQVDATDDSPAAAGATDTSLDAGDAKGGVTAGDDPA